MTVNANVSQEQITASVSGDDISVSISGGAGGVTSLQGLTGGLTLAAVGGTWAAAGSTITLTVTGAGSVAWADITGKPTASQLGAAATAVVYEFSRSSKPTGATGSTPGPYTWSLPANAKVVEIVAIGGGAGGGSGRRGADGTARFGGGGGGGGSAVVAVLPAAAITTSLTITVGSGGAGGAARTTDDTNGANGLTGGQTVVAFNGANAVVASPGSFGHGGTAAAGNAGQGSSVGPDTFRSGVGGNSSVTDTAGSAFRPAGLAATGGAAGGGISSGNVAYGGGTQNLGSAQQSLSGVVLSNLTAGAASTTAAGGDGPNAPDYGYGGCGGGASANGFNSGAGGNGGNGYVRITVWF